MWLPLAACPWLDSLAMALGAQHVLLVGRLHVPIVGVDNTACPGLVARVNVRGGQRLELVLDVLHMRLGWGYI